MNLPFSCKQKYDCDCNDRSKVQNYSSNHKTASTNSNQKHKQQWKNQSNEHNWQRNRPCCFHIRYWLFEETYSKVYSFGDDITIGITNTDKGRCCIVSKGITIQFRIIIKALALWSQARRWTCVNACELFCILLVEICIGIVLISCWISALLTYFK